MKPTKQELELIQKIADCGEAYYKLPEIPNTNLYLSAFATHINRLQDMVAARTVWRAMTDGEIKP